jgi:hypothetical protein
MTDTFIYDSNLLTAITVGTVRKYLKKNSKNTCLRINTVKFNHLRQYVIMLLYNGNLEIFKPCASRKSVVTVNVFFPDENLWYVGLVKG